MSKIHKKFVTLGKHAHSTIYSVCQASSPEPKSIPRGIPAYLTLSHIANWPSMIASHGGCEIDGSKQLFAPKMKPLSDMELGQSRLGV